MNRISFSTESLFHALIHFERINEDLKSMLLLNYSQQDILNQQSLVGSKFLKTFAQSPQEVIAEMQKISSEKFDHPAKETDGTIIISVKFPYEIGYVSVIDESLLLPDERKTIRNEKRENTYVKSVRCNRHIMTNECQLIIEKQETAYSFCTVYPGELAPPLDSQDDRYWQSHLFIRHND